MRRMEERNQEDDSYLSVDIGDSKILEDTILLPVGILLSTTWVLATSLEDLKN